jgi:hypothetical protein
MRVKDLTILLAFASCMRPCTMDFSKYLCFHGVMKVELRISIKDCHRKKNLKALLLRPPYPSRPFLVQMNGGWWPRSGGPVSLTRLVTALRKSLVRAGRDGG